jgi:hypothetical protein
MMMSQLYTIQEMVCFILISRKQNPFIYLQKNKMDTGKTLKDFSTIQSVGSTIYQGLNNTMCAYDTGEAKLQPFVQYQFNRLLENEHYIIGMNEEMYMVQTKMIVEGAVNLHFFDNDYNLIDKIWVRSDDQFVFFGTINKTEIRKRKLNNIED